MSGVPLRDMQYAMRHTDSRTTLRYDMSRANLPTQAWGWTADGRPFYFRARHGEWALQLREHGWPLDVLEWPSEDLDLGLVARGDDDTHGEMAEGPVRAVLAAHL